ncbi:MAG: hypothetical protein ACAH95_18110 [Fimbriimonas sp.]
MKKLISTLIIAGAAFGLVSASFAQTAGPKQGGPGQRGPGGPGGGRMARMGKMQEEVLAKLNLTADQKKKIEAHNKKMGEKMKTMFESAQKNPGADRTEMRKKFMAMREEGDKGMKAILTAEQWKKFETLRKEAREKARKQFGGPGGPGAGGQRGGKAGGKNGG